MQPPRWKPGDPQPRLQLRPASRHAQTESLPPQATARWASTPSAWARSPRSATPRTTHPQRSTSAARGANRRAVACPRSTIQPGRCRRPTTSRRQSSRSPRARQSRRRRGRTGRQMTPPRPGSRPISRDQANSRRRGVSSSARLRRTSSRRSPPHPCDAPAPPARPLRPTPRRPAWRPTSRRRTPASSPSPARFESPLSLAQSDVLAPSAETDSPGDKPPARTSKRRTSRPPREMQWPPRSKSRINSTRLA